MAFWPLRGALRRLTEPGPAVPRLSGHDAQRTLPLGVQFRRSLHLFVVDTGCDNAANLTIAALQAPQYNLHRYGIYFADSPRHADLLVVLGPALPDLVEPLAATLLQVPEPFGVLLLDDAGGPNGWWNGIVDEKHIVGRLVGEQEPMQILAALLAIQKGRQIPDGGRNE